MKPPSFGTTDGGVTPWLPPTVNGGSAADTTASLLGQLYPTQQASAAAGAPVREDKGNWLTRLLPTGGGLAGGAGGAALGTAILPGIGTVLGGLLGAGLGSAGGKAGQNAIEGNAVGDDVLREGLLGVGGQAAGGILGKIGTKVVGGGLRALGGRAEVKAATRAQAEATQALSNEFPDAALNANSRKELGFGGLLDLASNTGIPKTAQGFLDASNLATGSNGYLTGVLDDIVRKGGKVNLDDYESMVLEALKRNPGLGEVASAMPGKTLSTTAGNTRKLFSDYLQQFGFGGEGAIGKMEVDPDNALNLLRQIGKAGQRYNGAATGSEGAGLKDVYDSVYKGLRGSIYDRSAINDAVAGYNASPEDIAGLLGLGKGQEQLVDHLVNLANNATNAGDLLGAQSQFVNLGKAGRKSLDYTQNVVGTSKDAKAAAKAAEGSGAGQRAMEVAGNVMTGNPAGAVGAVLGSESAKKAGESILAKLASTGVQDKVAKVMTPTLLGASQFLAHAPNYVPGQVNQPTGAVMNDQQGQQGAPQQPGGTSPNEQMLQMALVGLQNPLYAAQFAPIVEALMKGPIQQSASANTALGSAQQAFESAGGGQGLVGGLLSKLSGAVTGGPAKTYGAQRDQLIAQLTALGIPTSAVPELTNNDESAALQWQTLQSLVNAQGAGTGAGLLAGVR